MAFGSYLRRFREESNERLIKKLGDEILKFQEALNVEKKVGI